MRVRRQPHRAGLQIAAHALPAILTTVSGLLEPADWTLRGGIKVVVDINGACLNLIRNPHRPRDIPRPDACRKAIDGRVGFIDDLCFCFPGLCGDHRSEDFILGQVRLIGHISKNRWAKK